MTFVLWENQSFAVTSKKLYNLLLNKWFRTQGRSSRQEYIFRFLMMWMLGYTGLFIGDFFEATSDNPVFLIISVLLLILICCLFILSIIQMFFVTHRRLHDLNASGWCQLITFIPFGQILMIGFIFFKGTPGPNKYGPPPEY